MVVDQNFLKVSKFFISIFLFLFSINVSFAENLIFKKIVDLNDPWGSTFINNNKLLITEKSGKIKLINLNSKKIVIDRLSCSIAYEDVLKNPYLDDFYERMERWSFNLQIYFLNSRFNQMIECSNNKKDTIQDRTIYEDAFIFAPNLKSMG